MTTSKSGNGHGPQEEPLWPSMQRSGRHWYWDQMHFPRTVTPLTATTDLPCMVEGFTRAWEQLSRPLVSTRAIVVNGYVYFADIPFEGTEAELTVREAAFSRETSRRAETLLKDWRSTYQPQIQAQVEVIQRFDYEHAGPGEILDLLHTAREMRRNQWMLHDLVVVPAIATASRFFDLYGQLFGPDREAEAGLLLQGFPNLTIEVDQRLWQFRQRVAGNDEIRAWLSNFGPGSGLVSDAPGPMVRSFGSELKEFLEQFGWRSDDFELSDPTWCEDPTRALTLLLMDPKLVDAPEARFRHAAQVRSRLEALARERLSSRPGDLSQFNELLSLAQQYLPVQEDHNYPIDQLGRTVLRLPLLALGKHFAAAGIIDRPDDIFFLTVDEVGMHVMDGMPERQQETVAIRRADWESWKLLTPPPYLGAPPPPQGATGRRFWGANSDSPLESGVLDGQVASPGEATGRARVILDLSEASRLQAGDILVCRTTLPSWTPLFQIAGAVVTDSGGTLSHAAIVTREYGIPCVVGTRIGSMVIRDGQTVSVDGTSGKVRLH